MASNILRMMRRIFTETLLNIRCILLIYCLLLLKIDNVQAQDTMTDSEPLRVGIIGVVHGHVHGFLGDAMKRSDIHMVGLVEEDNVLLEKYADKYGVPNALRYSDLDAFLDEQKPEAIAVFSNTFDHAEIVEKAAKRGVHVMMEKPLAVNMDHASRIERAARESSIHVLVNYETTWYPSNIEAYRSAVDQEDYGTIRKIVVHDGHWGPKEIGVDEEFLEWLTDPVLNGGGALTDFGCYGANLMTWLLKGEKPVSVFAVSQQFKTDPIYSKVDDETTIMVEYAETQGIIQASWNWPWHRKDMEVYGDQGYVFAVNRDRVKTSVRDVDHDIDIKEFDATPLSEPYHDPFSYLKAVVRGEVNVQPHDLSALENNIMVTRILDAARVSAETGKRVYLNPSGN